MFMAFNACFTDAVLHCGGLGVSAIGSLEFYFSFAFSLYRRSVSW